MAGAEAVGGPASPSASHQAGSALVGKQTKKGTLKIIVSGAGSYTVAGKSFRKSGRASTLFRVKPGRYIVKAPAGSVKPGKVKVRKGKVSRVKVTFPGPAQTPPPTPAPTPTPTTPGTPPPSTDVALSRQVSLPPGSTAVVDLGPDLASLTSLTGGTADGQVSWSVDGGLTVAVAAGAPPGTRQIVATGLGCVAVGDCGRSVSVSIAVTVLPLQAAPGAPLAAVAPPSPDRVAQAENVSEGIDVLTDEATIVVDAADPAAGRLVADAAASAVGAVVVSGLSEAETFQLRWTNRQDIKGRLAALVAQPGVRSAEAGLLAAVTGNEVGAGDEPEYGGDPWNLKAIYADAAWDQGVTGSGVTIGILDVDGVVSAHEDLPSISYPGGSGVVAQHATKVAGLACAKDNGKGVIGVAPGCALASVRLTQDDHAYLNGYLNNLTQLVKAGARVVNNSTGLDLGCKPYAGDQWVNPPKYYPACAQEDLEQVQQVLDGYSAGRDNAFASWLRTIGRETVVVVAAGNDALPEATNLWSHFAARGDATNVLTVASTDRNGNLSFFSDFGSHVDVAAPGGGVKSTIPGNEYKVDSGTSFAAPMVAGAAALIKQKYPTLDGSQIAHCLRANTHTFVQKRNDKDGLTFPFTGRIPQIDVGEALQCGIDPPTHPKTVNSYIARDPGTGRSVLVDRGRVYVIGNGGLFNCLARTRAVWDIANLKALHLPADGVPTDCYDEGPAWTYTPTAQGGNTGTDIILRDTSTAPHTNYLINSAGELQAIPNDAVYQCLAASNPVIWNVPEDKITAWRPVGATAATCGGGALRPETITAGGRHTCALDAKGRAWCWGLDYRGEIGDGDANQDDKYSPVAVAGDRSFGTITAGTYHTCALDTAGKAWCWGSSKGRGDGTNQDNKYSPVAVAGNRTYTTIAAGGENTCALDTSGKAWCWGDNYFGQIGDGDTNAWNVKYSPVAVAGNRTYTSIAAGDGHTCALDTSGKAWCWGWDGSGQLGTGDTNTYVEYTPAAVAGGHTYTTITAGTYHTCALDTTGKAWCWGDNDYGQIGDGTASQARRYSPVPVAGDRTYTTITARDDHTCVLDIVGKAWCWGWDGYGQIGDGTASQDDKYSPVEVAGDHFFATP